MKGYLETFFLKVSKSTKKLKHLDIHARVFIIHIHKEQNQEFPNAVLKLLVSNAAFPLIPTRLDSARLSTRCCF